MLKSIETKNHAVTFFSERGIGFLALENGQISKDEKRTSGNIKIADLIKKMQNSRH